MKRLETCCCCCSPRTGAIVIAVLGLVLFAIQLLLNIYYSASSQSMKENWQNQLKAIKASKENVEIEQSDVATASAILNWYITYFPVLLAISYIRNIMSGVLNALMLYGVMRNRPNFILPWTIIGGIGLIIDVLIMVGVSITLMVYESYTNGFLLIFSGLITLLIGGYFWCVVHTVYKDIRDSK